MAFQRFRTRVVKRVSLKPAVCFKSCLRPLLAPPEAVRGSGTLFCESPARPRFPAAEEKRFLLPFCDFITFAWFAFVPRCSVWLRFRGFIRGFGQIREATLEAQ